MNKNLEIRNPNDFEFEVRTVVEWADEGPGSHNFLRIVTDELSQELKKFLEQKGYKIIYFDDLDQEGKKEELQRILIDAQSYMNRVIKDKIAVVVSKKAREQIRADQQTKDEWQLHSQYATTFEV